MESFDFHYRWSTNDLNTNASVLLNNIGLSSASIDLSVRQGALDAHGGVIGGYIEVSEIAVDGEFANKICQQKNNTFINK